jgi:uncharacterized protein
MLTNTFLHIPYVSEKTEQDIWSHCRTWDDFLDGNVKVSNSELIKKFLVLSKDHYSRKDHTFFSDKLQPRHHWRAYEDFKDKACFLDIETTGLDKHHNEITVIGLYDGKESKVYVNGKNLEDFKEEIKKYSYIVTFNGSLFDLPFIKARFPDVKFDQMHADLRFVLRSLNLTGGLKRIEQQMGIERDSEVAGMNGYDAVKLWQYYKRFNDERALEKLIKYNIEDIENLKTLMDFAYPKMKESCFNHS